MKSLALLISYLLFHTGIYAQEAFGNDYYSFLKEIDSNKNREVNVKEFYTRSENYWSARLDSLYDDSYKDNNETLDLFLKIQEGLRSDQSIQIDRFEKDIQQFRNYDAENTPVQNEILFIGSSSINLWKTALSFPDYKIVNRGFGGASTNEILHYYNDLILKFKPSTLVLYSDIDLENGCPTDKAVQHYTNLLQRIQSDFPACQIILLSLKPTPRDLILGKQVRENKKQFNLQLQEIAKSNPNLHYIDVASVMLDEKGKLRKDIFLSDGMHLNDKGYVFWTDILAKQLQQVTK